MPWRQENALQRKLKIIRAIREQYEEEGTYSQNGVAARTGFDRATIRRHVPNLSDALHMMAGKKNLKILLATIEGRSRDEPPLCMAIHAFLDTVRKVATSEDALVFLRENAEFMASTPEGSAIVLDYLNRHWWEPITETLAVQHDRKESNLYDRQAADQVFLLSRRVLDEWRLEGYERSLVDVTTDLISQLGHHEADGGCLFASPPLPAA